ncbi:MAG: hypothetical protein ACQEQW_05305 [Bacteroidota bacterium]
MAIRRKNKKREKRLFYKLLSILGCTGSDASGKNAAGAPSVIRSEPLSGQQYDRVLANEAEQDKHWWQCQA